MIKANHFSIEQYASTFKNFDVNATQITPGSFSCREKFLPLPMLDLCSRTVTTAIQYHAYSSTDKFFIMFPKGDFWNELNGIKIKDDCLFIVRPKEEVIVKSSTNTSFVDVVVSPSDLAKYLGLENTDKALHSVRSLITGDCLSQYTAVIKEQMFLLISNIIKNAKYLSYQSMLDAQETILVLLSEILAPLKDVDIKKYHNNRFVVVKRALSYIHDCDRANLTILELSNICFCSVRSLEYAFKSILYMTPKQYLIKRRFHLIHKEINTGKKKIIGDIALQFGIINAGRFSKDYFNFYGEYPSQTIQKCT